MNNQFAVFDDLDIQDQNAEVRMQPVEVEPVAEGIGNVRTSTVVAGAAAPIDSSNSSPQLEDSVQIQSASLDVEVGKGAEREVSTVETLEDAVVPAEHLQPARAPNRDVPVGTALRTVRNSIDAPQKSTDELQRELVVMLPPIIPAQMADLSPGEDAAFLIQDVPTVAVQQSTQKAKPMNVDATSWYPRHLDLSEKNVELPRILPPSFSNVVPSPEYPLNDYDVNESGEEEYTDRDSQEDFWDSQSVRDDFYLEKHKKRHSNREHDTVQFRGRGRPLGSRNRTFFDAVHAMTTRSKTLD